MSKYKILPESDRRTRWSKSVGVWLVTRKYTKKRLMSCGIIDSFRRSIETVEGKDGYYIRFRNHFYPLHTPDEFSELIRCLKKNKIYFFHYLSATSNTPKIFNDIEITSFIYDDEESGWYR